VLTACGDLERFGGVRSEASEHRGEPLGVEELLRPRAAVGLLAIRIERVGRVDARDRPREALAAGGHRGAARNLAAA
jgi:hypothetical protein